MQRIEYKHGEIIGKCIFIDDVIGSFPRRANFECIRCGNTFNSLISSVKNLNTRSCGCLQRDVAASLKYSHGYGYHRLYKTWHNIKSRCYNEDDIGFESYGGRGITMFAEWREKPDVFIKYVESLPNATEDGYSIDRIDNTGNYVPGNIRWATMHTQNVNRGVNSRNTTGYTGVCPSKGKFRSSIMVNGIRIGFGHFGSAKEGAMVRDQYIINNKLWEYPLQILTK